MKYFYRFLLPIVAFLLLQSCSKEYKDKSEVIIELFTYGARINWVEDSIKVDRWEWTKIDKGNVFTWLSDDSILNNALKKPNGFATYHNRNNLKTDFLFTIIEDQVFQFRISSDSIYFLDKNNEYRTDIKGRISLYPDTSLVLHNTIVEPAISIKYRRKQ